MKDRVSTKILNNGATRYGVYDETGKLLRYEYIKLEDEPSTEGDFFNKANMLPDSIPAALGLKMANPQVKDALNVLANVGNLHVWERVQTYAEPVPEVPAGYTLGEVETDVVIASASSVSSVLPIECSSSVSVSYNGTVSLNSPENNSNRMDYWALSQQYKAWLQGKFVIFINNSYTSGYSGGEILYYPSDAVFTTVNVDGEYQLVASKLQRVTGYPYTPAIPSGTTTDYLTSTDRNAYTEGTVDSTTITYLGQLGGGARIEVGSYVGTGTYGKSSPNSLTFDFVPKVVMLLFISAPVYGQNYAPTIHSLFQGSAYNPVMVTSMLTNSPQPNVGFMYNSNGGTNTYNYAWISSDKRTIYWYNTQGSTQQFNGLAYQTIPNTYHYVAIG